MRLAARESGAAHRRYIGACLATALALDHHLSAGDLDFFASIWWHASARGYGHVVPGSTRLARWTRGDACARWRGHRIGRVGRSDSEKVAVGLALEELEKPKAKERSGTKTDLQPGGPGTTRSTNGGKTRDIVGNAIGMTGCTRERASERNRAPSATKRRGL